MPQEHRNWCRLLPSQGWTGLRAQAPNVAPFVAVQQSTFVIAQAFYIAWMDVMLARALLRVL